MILLVTLRNLTFCIQVCRIRIRICRCSCRFQIRICRCSCRFLHFDFFPYLNFFNSPNNFSFWFLILNLNEFAFFSWRIRILLCLFLIHHSLISICSGFWIYIFIYVFRIIFTSLNSWVVYRGLYLSILTFTLWLWIIVLIVGIEIRITVGVIRVLRIILISASSPSPLSILILNLSGFVIKKHKHIRAK